MWRRRNSSPAAGISWAAPSHRRTHLPRPSPPGGTAGRPGGHMGMHAHLSDARQAGTRRQRGPSVAVRGNQRCRRPFLRPGRRPLYVRGHRNTAVHSATSDTPRDREETARIAANPQLAGRFRRWWQVVDSNQRRLSRRFYSPLLLPEALPLTSAYALRGAIPGRRRPLCVRGHRVPGAVRATDGKRNGPRTGPVGAVIPTVPPGFPPLTCHFRRPARCRRRPRHRVWLGVAGCRGRR